MKGYLRHRSENKPLSTRQTAADTVTKAKSEDCIQNCKPLLASKTQTDQTTHPRLQ
jgi:hypothetical protein